MLIAEELSCSCVATTASRRTPWPTAATASREKELADALSAAGTIRIEEKRALGLVPERCPVVDPEPERRTRERLRTVLLGGTAAPADAAMMSAVILPVVVSGSN